MSFSNPQLDYKGNQNIITTDYGTLKVDKHGLATCTAVFKTKQTNWKSFPILKTTHPIFTTVGVDSYEISFGEGWAIATVNYAGLDPNNKEESEPVYELVFGLNEEPIETHIYFKSKIGGTAMIPLHGARFEREAKAGGVDRIASTKDPELTSNAGYIFKDFEIFDNAGTLNPKAKISSYLNANQVTWKKTFTRKQSLTAITKAGHIDTPDGPYPHFSGDGTWLNMGSSQTQKGIAFTCSTEWRFSGRRGWDTDIYK